MTPTIRDVAAHAGVSTATVSYVISGRSGGKTRIPEETRARVLDSIRELGYIPHATAQSLRKNRTERICLVIPNIAAPYWDLLAEEIMDEADSNGYQLVVSVVGNVRRELRVFHELLRGFADGAIVAGTCYWSQAHFAQLAGRGVAIAAISGSLEPEGFDVVRTQERRAREDVVDHLLGKGYQRLALLTDERNADLQANARDYLDILQDRGYLIDQEHVSGAVHDRESAHMATKELLERDNRPDAIITVADVFAIGALMAAKDLGVDVPRQLAIVGAGNVPETEITSPPLTTIGQERLSFEIIGELLFSRLAQEEPMEGRIIEFPRVLIKRGSA
jgi:LacI family transcriptional regulator